MLVYSTFIYINSKKNWSLVDEYAHFDNIEKFSNLEYPRQSSMVYPSIIKDYNERNFVKHCNDSTLSFNATCYSYEAHHPPLYYMFLAIPNKFMKLLNTSVFVRMMNLRIFSYLIYLVGVLFSFFIIKEINIVKYKFSMFLIYSIFCFSFINDQRYGLGNNILSLPVFHIVIFFYIKFIQTKSLKFWILFNGFCWALLFVSYTNILPLFLIAITVLILYKNLSFKLILYPIIISLISLLLLIIHFKISVGDSTISDQVDNFFNLLIPKGKFEFIDFLNVFLFDISFLFGKHKISGIIITLFTINSVLLFTQIKHILKYQKWVLVFLSYLIIVVISFFILNKYVAGVFWFTLRHYWGLFPLFFLALFSFPIVLSIKQYLKRTSNTSPL